MNLWERTRLETFGERERERESDWTLRLRETTDSYSVSKGNQQTARTVIYFLTKYSVVPTA